MDFGYYQKLDMASELLFRECILNATVHAKSTVGQRLKPTNAKFLSYTQQVLTGANGKF